MSDTTEPLSAILAEMRDERIIRLDGADVTRCLLRNLADRIEAAKKKHPKFVDCFLKVFDENRCLYTKGRRGKKAHIRCVRDNLQDFRDDLKWSQDNKLVDVGDILSCEICEAEEAYITGELAHAVQELAQCAAVCIRAMEHIEKEMEGTK